VSAILYVLGCADMTATVNVTAGPLSDALKRHEAGDGGCEEKGSPLLLYAETCETPEEAEKIRAALRALDADGFARFLENPDAFLRGGS
jgi:hypothetical protein